ncbi:uncharacterized protein METZ01_LOCUS102019, partial [marine metagenome]
MSQATKENSAPGRAGGQPRISMVEWFLPFLVSWGAEFFFRVSIEAQIWVINAVFAGSFFAYWVRRESYLEKLYAATLLEENAPPPQPTPEAFGTTDGAVKRRKN